MVRRLGIVHRWAGSPGADWYPWLRDELARARAAAVRRDRRCRSCPSPTGRDPTTWVPAVSDWLGRRSGRTWRRRCSSVTASAARRSSGRSRRCRPRAGRRLLLVAPWFWLDEDERDETSALWEESPFDERGAGRAAGRVVALVSTTTPSRRTGRPTPGVGGAARRRGGPRAGRRALRGRRGAADARAPPSGSGRLSTQVAASRRRRAARRTRVVALSAHLCAPHARFSAVRSRVSRREGRDPCHTRARTKALGGR